MEKVTLKEIIKLNPSDLVGKIIVFPTDTVYGVACLYGDDLGKEKIYEMKKRDYGKPLPVLCSSLKQANEISHLENNKYTSLWPGALTIVVRTKPYKNVTSETVAIRIPNSSIALEVIDHFGPLYTTSVKYSGEKEINTVSEIENRFSKYVDYIVTDEASFSRVPSTVIDCTKETIKVLREGSIKIN